MNERLKNLLKRIDDQKNESIFNICVNQIVKLFSLNPRFGGLIMAKIVQFMMSKEMFKRQLAAALFEELAEPVYEQISRVLEDTGGQDHMTSIFVVEPFAEILGEKTTDFDKIVESSMKDMDLEKMLMHIRNPQNYLYSKNEKHYNQSKKNKTNAIDETYVMSRIGGTETFDVRTIGESDNPEEYLISCIEKSKGKKPKSKLAKKATNKDKEDDDDDDEKEEISDEITKKLKIQEDGTIDASEGSKVRISTILIRILDVARLLLFNLNWEIRHGASLIIRAAARKANIFYYFNHYDTLSSFNSKEFIMTLKNQIDKEKESGIRGILEDSVIRSLLILALDRFSDFIGDKSNIIVRDISSQAVADSLNFLKSQELTVKMIKYFKELLGRDIKQGWEPKHGAIYLMYKLIAKNPKPTPAFFKEFCDLICSKIAEHEEILEVSSTFFQQVLINDETLVSNKTLVSLCKAFLEATQKLDDISFSVSPASRLIGDLFRTMQTRGTKEESIGADPIKTIMVKFFFHHTLQVRTDLFYMLSNWLVYQGKRASADAFTGMKLLMKMYLIGIYTEVDAKRREEMINHFYACTESFNDTSNLGFLSLIAEFSSHWTIKEFLNIMADKEMEEMVQNNRNWAQTSEETISSTRVFLTLGDIVWKLFEKLSAAKKVEVIKVFTGYQRNTLCSIFVLSVMHRCSASFKEKELKGLQLPNPQEMLELSSQNVATPQVDALMHTFLGHLDTQVRDYLGGLEFPEMKVHLFKLLSLLQNFREQKFASILSSIESIRNDLVEVKKTLHQLAMASKIPFGVYKLQAETLDIKVRSCDQILKHITDLMLVTEKIALYAKGTSAAILNKRALESKSKPQNLNGIIKPLLSLTKLEEVEPQWAQLFAEGMFTLCLCYANETAHPNHKVVVNLLTYCQESAEKMALEAKEAAEKDSSLKTQKVSLEIAHLNCLRYFCLIFETYKETAFEKYHNLKEIFNSPKLIRLFLPIFSRYCPVDVLQAALTKVKEMAASACKNPDLAEDFKVCFAMLFLDAHSKSVSHPGHADLLNSLLSFLHEEICKPSAIGLETLMDMLQRFDREMLPYSKIYIKRSLKLINAEIDYDHKRLVYDIFSKILTLSYVQDSDEKSSVLNAELSGKWDRGNEFLLEFRSNKLYNVDIPDVKSVKLRPYQLEGIAWVNFLFKYNLSGALCDDMGLGKTIQSLITVLIFSMKNKGSKSLIVCPNGLVKHWEMEAIKHYQGHSMKVAIIDKSFNGTWKQFKDINLFITSDHMIIKAAHLFEKEHFLVGVLDEAHLIKNEKSKLSKAIKTLTIQHKLALTGTPIQNNLLELWSIFDFLMPNYLGSKEDFKKNFARLFNLNLINIDISKMDLNDEQTKDLQLLHQRVLPFIMRRLKTQVLQDLPEKIIQDYYCEMTDVQRKVYKHFEDSDLQHIEKSLTSIEKSTTISTPKMAKEDESNKKKIPLLQALICMRKICNHPYLIGSKYFGGLSAEEEKDVKAFDNSGKFRGLRTLFEQLGFDSDEDNYDNPNKILIFSRFLDTIAMLENFFKAIFPTVRIVKIDGQIDATARYGVIDKFFTEFDIKVMLLTTKVGGLGLNLSCANIVVMFDHDFNPMNDLQAIERAHRLGQKKVVNVYRFIVKDTLEERIMGIQKFKLSVANTVINADNASISNIKDSKLLTLLDNLADEQSKKFTKEEEKAHPSKKEFSGQLAKMIEESDLKQIWDEDEYDKEYR